MKTYRINILCLSLNELFSASLIIGYIHFWNVKQDSVLIGKKHAAVSAAILILPLLKDCTEWLYVVYHDYASVNSILLATHSYLIKQVVQIYVNGIKIRIIINNLNGCPKKRDITRVSLKPWMLFRDLLSPTLIQYLRSEIK